MKLHTLAVGLFVAILALVSVGLVQDDATQEDATQETDELLLRARQLFEPIPLETPEIEGNVITPERQELGKALWFDPRLSSSWVISCNSCHNLGTAGVDLQPTSVGHAWQRGGRNSPTVLNAVFNVAQFWDGRAENLATQAVGPIQDALEMNNTPERVLATLSSMPGYVDMFAAAFPEQDEPLSFESIALAIEAFEADLLTPNAPFDQYLRGDTDALDETELAGLELFIDRGCVGCHGGINVGGQGYFPFGVVERPRPEILPPGDEGRYAITNVEADRYAFKSPTLRNIELTPPYFHSGVVWDLETAVQIMGSAQLGTELTDEEVTSITAFLGSLTGEQPQVTTPILPAITNTTPLPQPGARR